jgi:hypothetical protein
MFRSIFQFSIQVVLIVVLILLPWRSSSSDGLVVALALSNSLTRSSIRLTEPATGCEVILIGCFHGSRTSAADVREALDLLVVSPIQEARPGLDQGTTTAIQSDEANAIVLELCASRCADLMKAGTDGSSNGGGVSLKKTPWIVRYIKNIQTTAFKQGLPSAAATALLTGASGMQSSKIEPGLEFKTALDFAKARQIDVILADQSVDVTVEKLGRLPQTALSVLGNNEWRALATALAGATIGLQSYHLSLPLFLLRSKEAIGDAVGSLLRPLGIILTLQFALSILDASTGMEAVAGADGNSFGDNNSWGPVLNAMLIPALYTAVALPATKIVISDRDDVLTKGILRATRGRKRVVAVLGLLHVNGIADRLVAAGLRPTLRSQDEKLGEKETA